MKCLRKYYVLGLIYAPTWLNWLQAASTRFLTLKTLIAVTTTIMLLLLVMWIAYSIGYQETFITTYGHNVCKGYM